MAIWTDAPRQTYSEERQVNIPHDVAKILVERALPGTTPPPEIDDDTVHVYPKDIVHEPRDKAPSGDNSGPKIYEMN